MQSPGVVQWNARLLDHRNSTVADVFLALYLDQNSVNC